MLRDNKAAILTVLEEKAADKQIAGGWAVGEAAEGDRAGEQVGGVGGEYVCDSDILQDG